ncbi:ABC transporter ATP-binding protein [Clostridia bacterium]|nr:ABC transporter ATP-binding protein [Clostridia bacterium]
MQPSTLNTSATASHREVLRVDKLCTRFRTDSGPVRVVDDVSFTLREGEIMGIVGESGSGKSVTALSIMRLLTGTTGEIESGGIYFQGQDLTQVNEESMRNIRGNDIAMIFQEPMTCLNPVMRIGDQIIETIAMHQPISYAKARSKALDVLTSVRMPRAERLMREYPFQLSGGQRQRVMVAMGLICNPSVLIADEPTTALDVTIQAQILHLMDDIRTETGTAILLITHDLGVVAELTDTVAVMYCGRIMEHCTVGELFDHPAHPYTQGLMASIPRPGLKASELTSIQGNVPNPRYLPKGCRFAPRCSRAMPLCARLEPDLTEISPGHLCRCHLHNDRIIIDDERDASRFAATNQAERSGGTAR